jgi:hypothetical protein
MNKVKLLLVLLSVQTTAISQSHDSIPRSLKELVEFTIKLPDWQLQNQEEVVLARQDGGKTVSQISDAWKQALEDTKKRSHTLLLAFKYKKGTAVGYNPWISIVAERVSDYPNVRTAADYLNYVKSALGQTGLYTNTTEIDSVTLGPKQFHFLETQKKKSASDGITQRNYSFVNGDYALNIIFSYSNKSELKELTDIVESFRFKN